MALEQHLGDAGRGAEIAVDLERAAEVEEVGEGALGELEVQLPVGEIAVVDAGPEGDAPGVAPAGAAVPAPLQQHLGGVEELRVGRRDLARPGTAPQSGDMCRCVLFGTSMVVQPFLELAVLADLVRRDLPADARRASPRNPGRRRGSRRPRSWNPAGRG